MRKRDGPARFNAAAVYDQRLAAELFRRELVQRPPIGENVRWRVYMGAGVGVQAEQSFLEAVPFVAVGRDEL